MSVVELARKWRWQVELLALESSPSSPQQQEQQQERWRVLRRSREACLRDSCWYWRGGGGQEGGGQKGGGQKGGGGWRDLACLLQQKWFHPSQVRIHRDMHRDSSRGRDTDRDSSRDSSRDWDSGGHSGVDIDMDMDVDVGGGLEQSWFFLNRKLLNRVLMALHRVTFPNSSSREEWEATLQLLFDEKRANIHIADIWCWLGQEEVKSVTTVFKHIEDNEMSLQSLPVAGMWTLEEGTYRNIFHIAVLDDHLALLRLLCGKDRKGIQSCDRVNQTDSEEQSALHIAAAADVWRLPQLLALVQHPCVELNKVDRNSRTFLHCLLKSIPQRSRQKRHVDAHLLHQILTICLEIEHVSKDIEQAEPTKNECSGSVLVLMQDNCGLDLLDYAILSGLTGVISQLVAVLEAVPKYKLQADWNRYLRRAILTNKASTTMAAAEPLLRGYDLLVVDLDAYTLLLSGFLTFAVQHCCHKALMALLTFKEFVRAINVDESTEGTIMSPLTTALAQCKTTRGGRSIDIVRILLKFGANPLLKLSHDFTTVPSDHSLGGACGMDFRLAHLSVRDFQCSTANAATLTHDNVFSFIVSNPLQRSVGVSASSTLDLNGCSRCDVLRALLLATRHAACFVPSFSRRAQADEVVVCPGDDSIMQVPGRSSSEAVLTSLHYFFDYACFCRNPLVSLLLTSGVKAQELNKLYNPEYLRFNPFHISNRMQDSRDATLESLQLLEYLLLHTPFANLLDIQEGYTGLTPLACACWTGNSDAVDVLLQQGANPNMKINAFLANPSRHVHDDLTSALGTWNTAVHRARIYESIPALVAKKALSLVQEYDRSVQELVTFATDALDSLQDDALEVLAVAEWVSGTTTNISATSPAPFMLPANSIEFFDHFISLLDLLDHQSPDMSRSEVNSESHDNKGRASRFVLSRYASNVEDNLLALRRPSLLIKRARKVFDEFVRQLTCHLEVSDYSDGSPYRVPISCFHRNVLDRLQGMDKFQVHNTKRDRVGDASSLKFSKLNARLRQSNAIKDIQHALGTWSHRVLQLHNLAQNLNSTGRTELEAGLALGAMEAAWQCQLRCLDDCMNHQRMHTAHNYIIHKSASVHNLSVPQPPGGLYDLLFSTEPSLPPTTSGAVMGTDESESKRDRVVSKQRQQQQLGQASLQYTTVLSGHQPYVFANERRRRVQSFSRCDRMWWWDAIDAKDWSLVREMLPDICLEESCFGLEQLVVHLILREAPLSLLIKLVKNGMRLGRTNAHLKLAVANGNPLLLLVLLVCGTFATDTEEFWMSLLSVYHEHEQPRAPHMQQIPQDDEGFVIHNYNGRLSPNSNDFINSNKDRAAHTMQGSQAMRCRSVLEILNAGLASAVSPGRDKECSFHRRFETGSQLVLPQSCGAYTGMFSVLVPPLAAASGPLYSDTISLADIDVTESSDSDDEGTALRERSDHRAQLYVNKESVVRSPMGQVMLFVSSRANQIDTDESAKWTVQGALGLNGRPVTLPVIPNVLLLRSRHASFPLSEFWRKELYIWQPEDRFLLSPSTSLCADVDASGMNCDNVDAHLLAGAVGNLYRSCSRHTSSLMLSALRIGGVSLPSEVTFPFGHDDSQASNLEDRGGRSPVTGTLLAARCGNVGLVEALLDEYLSAPTSPLPLDKDSKMGFEEYYTKASSGDSFTVDVAKMTHLIHTGSTTRRARCRQRRQNFVSGLRGRIHYHSTQGKACTMIEPDGTMHKSSYSKVHVNEVFSSVSKFIDASVALQGCQSSWLTLHRAGVFECFSTLTSMSVVGDSHVQMLTVAPVLQLLKIRDAPSLHRYICGLRESPVSVCYDVVCSLESAGTVLVDVEGKDKQEPLQSTSTSFTPKTSLTLQPLRLWQDWIHSLAQLLERGGGLRLIWDELVEINLLETAKCPTVSQTSILSDWFEEVETECGLERESSGDAAEMFVADQEESWSQSTDQVFKEELCANEYAAKCSKMRQTVIYNLHCLLNGGFGYTFESSNDSSNAISPSLEATYQMYGTDYYRHIPSLTGTCDEDIARENVKWLHSSSLPLLCIDINSISACIQLDNTTPEYLSYGDVQLDSLLASTSKSLFYIVGPLLDVSTAELSSLSSMDLFRMLVRFSEKLHESGNGSDGKSKGGENESEEVKNVLPSLLDLELRDSLLAQAEHLLETRTSSLDDALRCVLGHNFPSQRQDVVECLPQQVLSGKSTPIDLQQSLESQLRVAKHFSMFCQACRVQNKKLLVQHSITVPSETRQESTVNVPASSTSECSELQRRLDLLLLEAVRSKKVALVTLVLRRLRVVVDKGGEDSSFYKGDGLCGISRSVWEVACASGEISVVKALLAYVDDSSLTKTSVPLNITDSLDIGGWSLVHCALTGFSSEAMATKKLRQLLLQQHQCSGASAAPDWSISTLGGSPWFPGECSSCPSSVPHDTCTINAGLYGYSGRQRRKIVRAMVAVSGFFFLPYVVNNSSTNQVEIDANDGMVIGHEARRYPYSALDLCAAAGCWSSVDIMLRCSDVTDLFSFAAVREMSTVVSSKTSVIPKLSLFLHHSVARGRGDILDSFIKQLMLAKKTHPAGVYNKKLHLFASMLSSRRQFYTRTNGPSEGAVSHYHFLVHDALLIGRNENVVKKLIWMTKSVYDEIDDTPCLHSDSCNVRDVAFHHGLPCDQSMSSASSLLRNNNLYHYSVLACFSRVLCYLLQVDVSPAATTASRLCGVVGLESAQLGLKLEGLEGGGCKSEWTTLQVALRWGSVESVGAIISHSIDLPTFEVAGVTAIWPSAMWLVMQALECSRRDAVCAYVVHRCLVVPQLEKTMNIYVIEDPAGISDMLDAHHFYCPPEKRYTNNAFWDEYVSSNTTSEYPMESDILHLVQRCYAMGWYCTCCLLVQYHFLILLTEPASPSVAFSTERKDFILGAYQELFMTASDRGVTPLSLALFSFFRDLRHTWLHPVAPPALIEQHVYPHTFFTLVHFVTKCPSPKIVSLAPISHVGLSSDSPPAAQPLVPEDVTSATRLSVTPDDIFIDLVHFRSLLLDAEEQDNGEQTGHIDYGKDTVISEVLGLPLLDRENIKPLTDQSTTQPSQQSQLVSVCASLLDKKLTTLPQPSSEETKILQPILPLASIGSGSKRIVVIKTKDGRKATFLVKK